MNRRDLALALVASTSLAACSTTPVIDIQALETQIANIITKVQQGVKNACSLVPTADSVLAVLMAIAGSNAAVAAFLAAVQEGITFISQACSATPAGALGGTITIKGKDVPVNFY